MSSDGVAIIMPLDGLIWLLWLGPALWLALAWAFIAGRRRMRRFQKRVRRLGESPLPAPPHVTVLVPVKDEAGAIENCVRGLLAQDYPAFDVLVINDRSSDGTGEVLERLATQFPQRLRVMHVAHLPEGWLGKPHALHAAVARHVKPAAGWLLLVDSDVAVNPPALGQMMCLALQRDYAMVSLMTGLVAPTLLERLLPPMAGAVWGTMFRIADTNDDNRATAAANGQLMLVRREALEAAGGHAAVRDRTCEDVELARRIKAGGGRVRFFLGQTLARTRMHASYRQMLNGWARNFAGTARHDPLPLLLALALLWQGASAFIALPLAIAAGAPAIAAAACAQALVIAALAWIVYRDNGSSATAALLYALLFPIVVALLTPLLLNGVRACFGGTVTWRGSAVRA